MVLATVEQKDWKNIPEDTYITQIPYETRGWGSGGLSLKERKIKGEEGGREQVCFHRSRLVL